MSTMSTWKPSPKKTVRAKTHAAIVAGALALFGGLGAGVWWMSGESVPSADASPVELVKFASTDTFAKMPLDQKRPFIEKMEGSFFRDREQFAALPEQQRREGMRNLFEASGDLRTAEFFQLKTLAERNAHLDKQLDEMAKRMAERQARTTTRPPGENRGGNSNANGGGGGWQNRGDRGGPPNAGRQKERIESRDSVKSALRAEMMAKLRERAEARGVPFPRGGRGNG
ncbi:MAG TPA: hypothetical protein VGB55_09305 [Tepidisphaeraceae bacterium]|jgi:hypothetical protein